MSLDKQFYFLSPVEVVKVTADALQEAADWCGGKVIELDSVKRPGEKDVYVWVPTPQEGSLSSAYPGMYITRRLVIDKSNKLKFSFAVFRRDYFGKNYFPTPADAVDKTWERAAREEKRRPKPPTDEERLAAAVAVVKELMPGAEIIDVEKEIEGRSMVDTKEVSLPAPPKLENQDSKANHASIVVNIEPPATPLSLDQARAVIEAQKSMAAGEFKHS